MRLNPTLSFNDIEEVRIDADYAADAVLEHESPWQSQ
jgi:hypothetical protein